MIVLAIIVTALSLVLSALIVIDNGMSDSSAHVFRHGWLLGAAWFVAGAFWLAWWVG